MGYFSIFLFATLFLCLISAEKSKPVKFPKDQRTDVRFPPDIEMPSSPELPIGHLRPLGRQKLSNGEVSQGNISDWTTDKPLLFKSLLKGDNNSDWSKLNNYDPKSDGEMLVMVAKRKRNGMTLHEHMKLSAFLEDYGSEDWLMEQIVRHESLKDFKLPEEFALFVNQLLSVSIGLSSGITSNDMKVSTLNKLECVLDGRRDYIIMEKDDTTPNTPSQNPQVVCKMDSTVSINPDSVNVFENPWIVTKEWHHASLWKGDCVLLPAATAYHTMSYGMCKTMTFNWGGELNSQLNKTGEDNFLRPFLCSNIKNQIQLCDCKEMRNETRWQQLFLSLAYCRMHLDLPCVAASLAITRKPADKVLRLLGDGPVTKAMIKEVKLSQFAEIRDLVCPEEKKSKPHVHDEL